MSLLYSVLNFLVNFSFKTPNKAPINVIIAVISIPYFWTKCGITSTIIVQIFDKHIFNSFALSMRLCILILSQVFTCVLHNIVFFHKTLFLQLKNKLNLKLCYEESCCILNVRMKSQSTFYKSLGSFFKFKINKL